MESRQLTLEQALYLVAVGLALALRLASLGASPLSDFEAAPALRAWEVSQGAQTALGPQPGYELSTGLLFFLLGSSNAQARLWPALAGAALAGLPYFFRGQLGRKAALILAFALALDPGLVALSRLAGGPMLAVGLGMLSLTAWTSGRPSPAGIFAGLSVLSGPALIPGLVGIGLAWGLGRLLGTGGGDAAAREAELRAAPARDHGEAVRSGILAGGGTLLLAGTLFLRFPQGLGALGGALPAYLEGWLVPSGVSALRLLAALVVYQPLAVLFGVVAGARAWKERDPLGRGLSLWLIAALALALSYPGRQVSDLAWALLPLWALAALELARYLRVEQGEVAVSAGLATLIFVLMAFSGLNLAGLTRASPGTDVYAGHLRVFAGVGGLLVLSGLLVALGWSARVARDGAVWGLGFSLALYTVSLAWGVVGKPGARAHEWWYPPPATVQEDLLLETIGDISEWRTGRRDGLEVVLTVEAPSLRWSLRRLPFLRVVGRLGAGEVPPLLITARADEPRLAMEYRGADVLWWASPVWGSVLPAEWLDWLVFRESPVQNGYITLWARADLFLDDSLSPAPAERPDEAEPPLENSAP